MTHNLCLKFLFLISTLMRTNFGNEAYHSKKIPFNIKLNSKTLKKIEEMKKTTQVIIGNNKPHKKCNVTVDVIFGNLYLPDDKLIENLQHLINKLHHVIPYGFKNVQKLQIRSLLTKPYHIYGLIRRRYNGYNIYFRLLVRRGRHFGREM